MTKTKQKQEVSLVMKKFFFIILAVIVLLFAGVFIRGVLVLHQPEDTNSTLPTTTATIAVAETVAPTAEPTPEATATVLPTAEPTQEPEEPGADDAYVVVDPLPAETPNHEPSNMPTTPTPIPAIWVIEADVNTLAARPKSEEQVVFENTLGRELTKDDVTGFSSHGNRIGNRLANRLFTVAFRDDVFRGLSGDFNTVSEMLVAIQDQATTFEVYSKALELMLDINVDNIAKTAEEETATGLWQEFLWNHANACIPLEKRRAELERREMLDGLMGQEYQALTHEVYKTHWVFRLAEVSQEQYEAATENFQGWHPYAPAGVYRAKIGVNTATGDFVAGEIFFDESEWAAPVTHFIKGDGLTVGGIRINDLCIVLPHDPCVAPPPSKPTPQPTVEPTPEPTPEPEEPKPSDGNVYEDHEDIVVDTLPEETPNAEPTNAPLPEATAPPATVAPTTAPTKAPTQAPTRVPTAVPTQAPTQAPTEAPTQAPTKAPATASPAPAGTGTNQDAGVANNNDTNGDSTGVVETIVIDEGVTHEPFPEEPPSQEPGSNQVSGDNQAIGDPD